MSDFTGIIDRFKANQAGAGGSSAPSSEPPQYGTNPPVNPDLAGGIGGDQNLGPELPRFDVPEASAGIDMGQSSADPAVKADVTTLSPPQDIDAATIGDYTPYQEVTGSVDPNSTVEGRLGGLLSQNNPYIDRARTEAAQLANRRGMLNSSMAAGSAEGAAIDRALPIAQQDARAFLEQQFLNQGYSNEAAKHLADTSVQRENLEAGFEQDTSQFNAVQDFEANKLNQSAENTASNQYAAEQNKNNFAVLSADLQAKLKGVDNEMAMRLETLTREYGLLENMDSVNGSIYQQMIQEMGTILANEEKASVAQAKINALIASAGVEMEFSNGMTSPTSAGGGGPSAYPGEAPPWQPPEPTRPPGFEGPGGAGGGVSGSDGPGGTGDSGGPTGGGGSGVDGR